MLPFPPSLGPQLVYIQPFKNSMYKYNQQLKTNRKEGQ